MTGHLRSWILIQTTSKLNFVFFQVFFVLVAMMFALVKFCAEHSISGDIKIF